MKKIIKILIILAAIFPSRTSAQEYLYILNDECINILYNMAKEEFKNSYWIRVPGMDIQEEVRV